MSKWGALLLATLFLGFSNAATINNGSFEAQQIGPRYQVFYAGQDLGGGWIVESGTVEIVGTYWPAAQGQQSVDLSGIFEEIGTIYQDIQTVPGKTYKIRFAFAGNPEDPGNDKRMKVFWNDGEVADLTYNTAGRSLSDMGWEYHTYTVTATGEISRLKFKSLTLSFLGPVIDDVSIEETATEGAIRNGGFEELVIGGSYQVFFAGADIGGGWTVENGTVELVRDYWTAAEGHQSVDLSGIFDQAGTIYQDIPTIPGQAYTLRFAFAGNPEDAGADKHMKVFWNDGELADLTFNTAGRSFTDMGWTYYTYTVTATSSSSRVKFQSLTFNFLGPVIDDVSLRPYYPASLDVEMVARVNVTGAPGDKYRIEYAERPEKSDWQLLEIVTIPPSGKTFALDADGVHGNRRIYRAILATP